MPRGGIEHPEGESKVDRVIRLAFEETRQRLLQALAPVEGDYSKLNNALIHIRNLIELLIGMKIGDHPICGVNAPRDFFAQAGVVRSGVIKELVGGKRLAELLAQYDEIAAVVVPLRAAIVDVEKLMGKKPLESAGRAERRIDGVDGHGRRAPEQSIVSWIAAHGSIRVTNNCAKQLRCSRTEIDQAIASLLAAGRIKEIGGSELRGLKYEFANGGDSRGGKGGNGVGGADGVDGRTLRAQRRRAEIQTAIFAELRTSDTFVISTAFCGKVGCAPETARGVLEQLVKEGVFTMEGNGPHRKYTITSKGRTEIRGGGGAALRA